MRKLKKHKSFAILKKFTILQTFAPKIPFQGAFQV